MKLIRSDALELYLQQKIRLEKETPLKLITSSGSRFPLEDIYADILDLIQAFPEEPAAHLPCKIGDRVWAIRCFKGVKHPQDGIVSEMFFTKDMKLHIIVKYVARGEWGKTVFPTREAAEEYMRKEKGNARDFV